ncbi:MAG: hypothetical protein KKA73_11310 [Chloroflexi bacterium]|nr:hypothetical protein [Chloroflexota bacterium]MBU1748266.1 hypothetical protein [Chloroflexota bacterium]
MRRVGPKRPRGQGQQAGHTQCPADGQGAAALVAHLGQAAVQEQGDAVLAAGAVVQGGQGGVLQPGQTRCENNGAK